MSKGKAGVSSRSGRLQKLCSQSEFLLDLSYHNSLPAAPCGPFFKKIGVLHTAEEFSRYNFSSLEKSYIWQPHFGPDANTRLDLVDREANLVEGGYQAVAESFKREIKAYTSGSSSSGVDLRKRETRQKHWWLRETVYSENNILKNRSAGNDEGARIKAVDDGFDPFSVEAIEKSFDAIKQKVGTLDQDQLEWSIPILPDLSLGANPYTFISFVENPDAVDSQQEPTAASSSSSQSQDSSASSNGKKRPRQTIITNIRESVSKKGSDNSYAVSMVAPPSECDTPEFGVAVDYQWTKDYRMIMKQKEWIDHVVLVVDHTDAAKYFTVGVNMEMDKLQIEEVDPHTASVVRREAEEDEEEQEEDDEDGNDEIPVEDGDEDDAMAEDERETSAVGAEGAALDTEEADEDA